MKPKVTVVIPCFNHGRYVERCVDSVLMQTYQDFQILVVNDGSTEQSTIDTLTRLEMPKTTVLHKENGHLSSARNHGIARSNSDYILTLDADDRLAPRFLERTTPILDEDGKVGIVTCPARTFGLPPAKIIPNLGGDITNFVVHNGCQASCLFRRKCWEEVGGYDESMKQGYEDWEFHIAVTERGWRIASVPETLFHYRVAAESMVVDADRKRPELVGSLVDKHRETFQRHVTVAIVERERRIQDLREELDLMRGSLAHRIGRCFTDPVAVIKAASRRLFNRVK